MKKIKKIGDNESQNKKKKSDFKWSISYINQFDSLIQPFENVML
jgi:hypothetical protein